MNEFEDVIYPNAGPSHVTTNVEYIEDDINNTNNENNLNLVQILKELVDNNLKEEIQFKPMVGGVTNTLFKSSFITSQGSNKSVIIRLYGKGSEQFIDRKTEANIQYLLSKNGVGPKFYGTFENGCIYGYVEGDQLQLEDLYKNKILSLIAKETGRWHTLKLDLTLGNSKSSSSSSSSPSTTTIGTTLPSSTSLFSNLNSWMKNALTLVKDYNSEQLAAGGKKLDIDIDYYRDEALSLMSFIEKQYSDHKKVINFCHNDLIPRNMIYNQEKNQVRFIDFEYSGYNYRGYDIGNFFCEFSGLDLDYSKYPSIEIQKRFIKDYLISVYIQNKKQQLKQQQQQQIIITNDDDDQDEFDQDDNNNNDYDNEYEPTEKEIHDLYIEANHFTLGSHIMWGFWGIIQHFSSSIDFDYMDYGKKRFKQYDIVKNKVLSLK